MAKSFTGALDGVSHKWRRLAERRQAHLVELFQSGRWKHYYEEERFLRSMREAIRMTERWNVIAPPLAEVPLPERASADAMTPDGPGQGPGRRDAA
jgi:uncharacterized repeat protein (TIGR03809 family)